MVFIPISKVPPRCCFCCLSDTGWNSKISFFFFRKSIFSKVPINSGIGVDLAIAVFVSHAGIWRLEWPPNHNLCNGFWGGASDFSLWGKFPLIFFLFLMFIGGCAGSTTCGIKVFRLQILVIFIKNQIKILS